MALSSNEKKS